MSTSGPPSPIVCRGVRGATTVERDARDTMLAATRELLDEMVSANQLDPDDLASAIFTTSPDLTAAYPAEAARQLGWTHVPLMCMHEMSVPGGLALCIRVLLHWNTTLPAGQVRHIYLREARKLRPDLAHESARPTPHSATGDEQ